MRGLILFFLLIAQLSVTAQVINRAEYFIDSDPGNGNGIAVPVSVPSASVNFAFTIPTTSLSTGFHTLGFRSQQTGTGFWSHAAYSTFYIVPMIATSNAINIVKAEYFYDTDPGNGAGVNVPIATVPNPTVSFTTPTSSLTPGFHTLHFRTKDDKNKWSIAHIQTFYIVPPPPVVAATNLVKAEYFFDTDPGQGNGTALSITAGSTLNNSFPIALTGLTDGFHRLNIRYKDNANTWSHTHQQIFYITPQNSFPATNIVQLEYYVDTDPGYGLGTGASFTAGASVDLLPLAINTTGILSGNHVLYVRAKDDKGFWSEISSAPFTISNCVPPSQPVVSDVSRCGNGTITLTATGATGTQQYRWYDDPVAGTQVGTGSPFTTASLTTSQIFYASVYDPNTLCESARVAVNATLIIFPKPTLNTSGTITLCEGGNVFLQAQAGFNAYLWSTGETTQQITAAASGSYSVVVGDGNGCFSVPSDIVSLTLISAPIKPTIQVTGDICSGSPVVLSGPVGLAGYVWSTGATTSAITINQAGSYSLRVQDAIGCQSVSSDPVVIGNVTPATITQVDNTLIASTGTSFQWFLFGEEIPGATKQILEINLFEVGIYSVEIIQGNCTSRSADFIYLITDEESDMEGIKVFPNPVSNTLTIEIYNSSATTATIKDVLGRKISDHALQLGSTSIDVNEFASGMYWVLIETSSGVKFYRIQKL